MDIDIIYLLISVLIVGSSLFSAGNHFMFPAPSEEHNYLKNTINYIGLTFGPFIYLIYYYYGIKSYKTKKLFIGIITALYIGLLIAQYIMIHESQSETECRLYVSSKVFRSVSDLIYRFIYLGILIAIPFMLRKTEVIFLWSLLAPVLIPLFLYLTSFILGLGTSSSSSETVTIDAGNYYSSFVRGIGGQEDYTGKNFGLNTIRSLVRGLLLIVIFIIAYLTSRKIIDVSDTSSSVVSLFVFLIMITSVIPLILGYLVEPKCLVNEAKQHTTPEKSTFTCAVIDKHGGGLGYVIYILVCLVIGIAKDY